MNKSESIINLATALAEFHKHVGKIKKEATNPFFKSKYASLPNILEAIEQPLEKAGLVFSQFPSGTNGLSTIIVHAKSGEWMEDTYIMPVAKQNDPQAVGSAITYARRYALAAAFGLNVDEDDDGNAASKPPKQAQSPQPDISQELKQVAGCQDLKNLEVVWQLNPELHNNPQFKTAVSNRKKELTA